MLHPLFDCYTPSELPSCGCCSPTSVGGLAKTGQALGARQSKICPPLPQLASTGLSKPWGARPCKLHSTLPWLATHGQTVPGEPGQGTHAHILIAGLHIAALTLGNQATDEAPPSFTACIHRAGEALGSQVGKVVNTPPWLASSESGMPWGARPLKLCPLFHGCPIPHLASPESTRPGKLCPLFYGKPP